MISALLVTTALSGTSCVDHSTYTFDLEARRLRNIEILRSEASGRSERGSYPDGTTVTVTAEYCTERDITMSVDAPFDAQNKMRLGQLFGQFDRIMSCPVSDWTMFDAAMDAADTALTAGETYDNGGAPIDTDGTNAIYLSVAPVGDRVSAEIRCVRPND